MTNSKNIELIPAALNLKKSSNIREKSISEVVDEIQQNHQYLYDDDGVPYDLFDLDDYEENSLESEIFQLEHDVGYISPAINFDGDDSTNANIISNQLEYSQNTSIPEFKGEAEMIQKIIKQLRACETYDENPNSIWF